ncbi:MAG TPA: response regulator transcription factor [Bacteroidota bacterium]|nr:response regulator transcription factor [Bacteroidota bacterium]
MKNIKVLIADDHCDFRRVVHSFLSKLPNISVVGEANDGTEAIAQVEKLIPDVVLMDIAMPRMNGLDATRIIKQRWPETKIYIATSHDDPVYRLKAIDAKADGFILKSVLKPSLEATFCTSLAPVSIEMPCVEKNVSNEIL